MSVTTAPPPPAARGSALWQLTLVELRLLVRERVRFVIGTGFPLLLLVIFGSIPSFRTPRAIYGGLTVVDEYVPILIAFSIALLGLTFTPTVLAGYREKGILRRLQTTPAGPGRVLAADFAVSLAVAAVRVILVLVVARLAYNVPLPRQLGAFVSYALLTALALLAVGLLIAAVAATSQTAQAIGIFLFFPLMFFAGLWLPIPSMPSILQHISHVTPLGAAVQALQYAANGQWPHWQQLLILAAYTVVAGLAAARLFRWE
jgi:ABC-2 type transport system permease protein